MKLVRMAKMAKEKSSIVMFLNDTLKLKPGSERLLIFVFLVTIFAHIMGCMWYFIAKLDDLRPETWVVRMGLVDAPHSEIYLTCIYYIFTTITTVGYGDISGETSYEK